MSDVERDASSLWREPSVRHARAEVVEFVVVSGLVLFWEICLIRWISTEVRVFAYYKNLGLLAAFLGFGIGLLARRPSESWLARSLGATAVLVCAVALYPGSPLQITRAPAFFEEFTWHEPLASAGVALQFYGIVAALFVGLVLVFVPFGERLAWHFGRLRPIPAYSLNVAASLVGLGVFSLASALGAPPVVWVAVGLLPLLAIGWRAARSRAVVAVLVALPLVVTGAQWLGERDSTWWSPYYKITVVPARTPPVYAPCRSLQVNHDYHQNLLDLTPAFVARQEPAYKGWAAAYELPYRIVEPHRVLVVGAGTGNDVAAALRHGAASVTAVEIDPTIQTLGGSLHPEHPYASKRVDVRVEDARTYLARRSGEPPFDLIVFGLLDSHTQVSGMSSLRLDNFVYTVESLERARALLEPNHGLLALSFSAAWGSSPWTVRRIERMLGDVFGEPPHALFTGYDAGISFLAGPAARSHSFFASPEARSMTAAADGIIGGASAVASEPEATDDWPFLYLRRRALPVEYWSLIALVLAIALVFLKRSTGRVIPAEGHFFCLGAAFMLVEAKNLVTLSLLFGSTWEVNTIAIGAILVMILLANLVAHRWGGGNPHVLYVVLLSLLAAGLAITPSSFSAMPPMLARIAMPLWSSVPLFVAGLVFVRSFASAPDPAAALGANVLGGIVGALLEYASLAFGMHALQWFAIGLYAASWALLVLRRRAAPAAAGRLAVALGTSPRL
jgi:spermidine synthase